MNECLCAPHDTRKRLAERVERRTAGERRSAREPSGGSEPVFI